MSRLGQSRDYVLADLEPGVRVFATTRSAGASAGASVGEWASFNLASHVEDDPDAVAENRTRLCQELGLQRVQWLNQVHGIDVLCADEETALTVPTADAAFTTRRGLALAVLTADCLPVVLLTDQAVGVAHCGWRGLAAGILSHLAEAMPGQLTSAWFGPGICGGCYQVDASLSEAFAEAHLSGAIGDDEADGKVRLSLATVAQNQLRAMGCERIEPSNCCSLCDERFYSYRRCATTGRMATVVCRD
ncbi:MAG: peptidoglycan editing factor PgeF [Pseudomonadaceae bacterium]|nr:peptidoglycan editing factor PgeF [Pseudomonadaceae bacterium]